MQDNVCDETVFESLFFKHGEYLRNFLYYKSGNLPLAEDLVQDAFSKLWENCLRVSQNKAKSFLFTVANNLFLNKVKRNKVRLKFEQTERNTEDHQDPQFALEEKEFRSRLESAISALPEGQRTVFLMNRIDGKTYKEIAEDMGLTVKAIEKRMHLALKSLREVHRRV